MTDPYQPSGWSGHGQHELNPPPSGSPYGPAGYGQPAYPPPTSQAGYAQSGPLPPGYGPPGYQQPQYGPPGYAAPMRTNNMAIASMVCSLAGLLTGISAPVGAILGHVARRQIRDSGEQGDGMALTGIIVGWVLTGLWILGCVAYVWLIAALATSGTQ